MVNNFSDTLELNYKPLVFPKDTSWITGLLLSLVIHTAVIIAVLFVAKSFRANLPAAGDDTSKVFDVELIDEGSFLSAQESSKIEQLSQLEPKVLPEVPELNEKPKPKIKDKTTQPVKNLSQDTKLNGSSNSNNQKLLGAGNQSFLGVAGGSGVEKPNYAQIVASRIEANKSYPRRARERGIEGKVIVSITVSTQGDVIDSHVVSSDSNLLSSGVDEIIRRASPFPAVPAELSTDSVTLQVPIRFDLLD